MTDQTPVLCQFVGSVGSVGSEGSEALQSGLKDFGGINTKASSN